jgi:hypothetical protein
MTASLSIETQCGKFDVLSKTVDFERAAQAIRR